MNLFFTADWTAITFIDSSKNTREENYDLDHVSFGHDIETAYLLLEASEIAGFKNDSITLAKAKQMVDHTIKFGWDDEFGGIFDRGYYFKGDREPKIIQNYKGWFWGGIDQVPGNKFTNKGSIWKVNYHTIRSLINCLNNLKNIN
jgi:mannobiose 2-epimerase